MFCVIYMSCNYVNSFDQFMRRRKPRHLISDPNCLPTIQTPKLSTTTAVYHAGLII